MGIFGRKKTTGPVITRVDCVTGTAVTAIQFLNGVSLSEDFSENEIFKVWSVIYASAIRCLQNENDKDFFTNFLKSQISSPSLIIAFNKAKDQPQEVLYVSLEGPSSENVSVIAKDLAINITNVALSRPFTILRDEICDLAIPVFEHHLKEHFPKLGKVEQLLLACLAGSFAIVVEDICKDHEMYGFENTNLRISVAQTIYALAPILYVLRKINE